MAVVGGVALIAPACGDYLSGPGISDDPNHVLTLSKPGPLYVGIQQTAAWLQEAERGHNMAALTQQLAGVARQAAQLDAYVAFAADWGGIYGAGGLLDIRKMEQLARRVNDSLYIGQAKVYEAIDVGLAADIWGDIPYRGAADSNQPQPHYDPQLQVYGDIQAQLDSAIDVFLTATGPSNVGGALDGSELVYAGRSSDGLRDVYTAVARSLKARFFMHVAAASVAGVSGAPAAAYDSALKYATAGIRSPADDMLWFHDASGANLWWWWCCGDWQPGAAIIEIMNRRILAGVEDTLRRAFYFTPASDGRYRGFRPTGAVVQTSGAIYDGSGPYSGVGAFMDQNASDGSFRPAVITYAETQLIAAEAAWHLNCTGCAPTVVVPGAQPFLDAARTDRRYGSTTFGTAPGTLPASLVNIIEEKYITLFLNPEVWNDWKRTCLPSLAPALGKRGIPSRFPYWEVDVNPNTPTTSSTGVAIGPGSLNPNQPTPCPALNYTTSSPLAN